MVEYPQNKRGTSACHSLPTLRAHVQEDAGKKLTRGHYWVKISSVKRGVQRWCVGRHMLFLWDDRHTEVSANF